MATISIGLGKTYGWDKGASVNLQDNAFTAGNQDGEKILAFNSPTSQKLWTSTTDWTENSQSGCDSAVVSSTYLDQYANTGDNQTQMYDADFCNGGVGASTCGLFIVQKIDSPSVFTTAGTQGCEHEFNDGTRIHIGSWRTDGTNFKFFYFNGSSYTSQTTTYTTETTRYHVFGQWNPNSNNADAISIGGRVYATNLGTYQDSGNTGFCEHVTRKGATGDVNVSREILSTNFFASNNFFSNTDGTWTSTYNDAIFDAGAGRQWAQVDFTHVAANSTVVTIEARTAASAGGLSGASYETIASSGDSIVTKGRFIQVRATLQDASTGLYTPVLTDITLTDEAAPAGLAKNYGLVHAW